MSQEQQQEQEFSQEAAPAAAGAPQPITASDLLDEIANRSERIAGKIEMTANGIEFGNFAGILRFANIMMRSGDFVPKGYKTAEQVAVAMLHGRQVGIPPLAAPQYIAVINGKPGLFGDAPLSVVRRHKLWREDEYEEWFEVDGVRCKSSDGYDVEPDPADFAKDSTAAFCKVWREGARAPTVRKFSVAMGKAAGLGNLHKSWPQRMTRFRARGFALRDAFGDALMGIGIAELMEIEPDTEPAEVDQQPPARSTVLDRVAASAPAAPIPTPVQEERQPAPVELPPAKPAASVVPPPALADLVAEVTAPEPARKGQGDLGRAVVRAALEEQREAATSQAPQQQSDSGEPDLAPLSAENATKLLAYAKLKAVKNPDVLAKLVAGHTEPGRYSQEGLRTFLKDEITRYETGTSQRTGAV